MPLNMQPKTMYELVKEKILTIDSVSTPIALEVTRKAVLGYDLDEIVFSLSSNISTLKIDQNEQKEKENVIISACLTGDGASSKIKAIIEKNVDKNEIRVINLNIIDNEDLKYRIKKLKNQYNIVALVSTLNIDNIDTPFISAIDILKGDGIKKIDEILKENELYEKVTLALREHLKNIDSEELIKDAAKHRKDYREVAKLSAPSGIFQINEPMMFGIPIVLNPILFIPFLITPGILTLIAYIGTAIGFAPPTYIAIPWTTPPIIGAFLSTGANAASIKAAILAAINLAVAVLIYLPFVKLADKQKIQNK